MSFQDLKEIPDAFKRAPDAILVRGEGDAAKFRQMLDQAKRETEQRAREGGWIEAGQ